MAAALALAAALAARRRARSGRPLAASLGQALSGVFAPGAPDRARPRRARARAARRRHEPGRRRPDAARPAHAAALAPRLADRPTRHSPRSCARSSLARSRRRSIEADAGRHRRSSTAATEDAWLRDRFHPGVLSRLEEFAVELAGQPGAVVSLMRDAGLEPDEPRTASSPATPRATSSCGSTRHRATSSCGAVRERTRRSSPSARGSRSRGGTAPMTSAHGQASAEYAGLLALAALLGATLALDRRHRRCSARCATHSPRLLRVARHAPAPRQRQRGRHRRRQSALLPGDDALTPDAALLALGAPARVAQAAEVAERCCSTRRARRRHGSGARRTYRAWMHRDDGPYEPVDAPTRRPRCRDADGSARGAPGSPSRAAPRRRGSARAPHESGRRSPSTSSR